MPGVRDVGTQVGQAVLGDQAVGSDSAEMWVTVDSSDHGRPWLPSAGWSTATPA